MQDDEAAAVAALLSAASADIDKLPDAAQLGVQWTTQPARPFFAPYCACFLF